MARISDANAFNAIRDRMQSVQAEVRRLQDQLSSGQRLVVADQDPLGAGEVVRAGARIAALGSYGKSASFGTQVLNAQDDALAQATNLLVRAEELASQQSTGLYDAGQRAAAKEELHGLLKQLTAIGNSELAGRRIFGGLALDAAAPFADPDTPGWTAATSYVGSTYEAAFKVGDGPGERVRVSTRGDTVFGAALSALSGLETTLGGTGSVQPSITALQDARNAIEAERASVGARQAQLTDRGTQLTSLTLQEQSARSALRDTDFADAASQLVQAQTALQAVLAAASQMKDTSLTALLKL
jgi:flagellar hook-associated protein 3 FlgL